jgi:outer membrane protein
MPHFVPGVRLLMALCLVGLLMTGRTPAAEGAPLLPSSGTREGFSSPAAPADVPGGAEVDRSNPGSAPRSVAGRALAAAQEVPPAAPLAPPAVPPGPAAKGPIVGTPENPLTLTEAIEIAFRNHANIAIAEENLLAARERVTQARTGTRPTITGETVYTGRGVSDVGGIFGPGPNRTVTDDGVQPALRARATLFDHGQTRLRVRQARTIVFSSVAGIQNARRLLRFLVTADYIDLLRAQQQLLLTDEQVRLAQAQLDLIDARIAVGDAAAADRFPVLRELRRAQERQLSARNNVNVGSTNLRNSMGLPAGPAPVVTELPQPTFEIPKVQESLTQAEQNRPDLQQNIAAVEVSRAAVSLTRVARRPLFVTTAGANLTPKEELSRADWNFALGVSMPIWDAGLTRAREREAEANLDSDRARLDQSRKDIAAEVQAAHLNLQSARERVDASEATVEAARVALDAANARYQQGLATTIDLTDAQVGFITARNDAINALYDYYLAEAQLERAIGR